MDVAFVGHTAYVLVTLVGGDIVGGPHIGDSTVGIYRLEKDGSFTVIADIGTWSADHPPTTDFFITTGVQYALETFRGGFLVTDGHHNRVLQVTRDGDISELIASGTSSRRGSKPPARRCTWERPGRSLTCRMTGRVVKFGRRSSTAQTSPRGEHDRRRRVRSRHQLYALSQGAWDGVAGRFSCVARYRQTAVGRR